MTWLVWLLIVPAAIWGTIRVLGIERGFPLVPLVAFTPYVAAASVLPVLVALALRRWMTAAVAAVVLVVLALTVLPRAFGGGGPEVENGVALRVLTTNIQYGGGDPRAIAGLVEELDVDLLSVQELTPAAVGQLRQALGGNLPEQALATGDRASGSGLFAGHPLTEASVGERLPGGFALPSATLELAGAEPVEVYAVHTVPPTFGSIATWTEDLRALPATEAEPLRILAGDFNATLDHAELRELLADGYLDAADAAGVGLATTWPNGRLFPPEVTIDHVLADRRIEVGEVSVHEIPGSDHRAVFAELIVPAG